MSGKSNPWNLETFRSRKVKTPASASLSRRQKRAEFKAVQKLVDFQSQRESGSSGDCSKLPTPRSFHAPKARFDSSSSSNSASSLPATESLSASSAIVTFKNSALDAFPIEDDEIWESRDLITWIDYSKMFLNHRNNMVTLDDVKNVFNPNKRRIVEADEAKSLNELIKRNKTEKEGSSDSGQGSETAGTSMEKDSPECLSDMDLFTSEDEEEVSEKKQDDLEDIVSDEEWS